MPCRVEILLARWSLAPNTTTRPWEVVDLHEDLVKFFTKSWKPSGTPCRSARTGLARTRKLTYAIVRRNVLSTPMWSLSARVPLVPPPPHTWLAAVCASHYWRRADFRAKRSAGTGLTPRGTRQLVRLGIDTSEAAGWLHNKAGGSGGERPFQLEWPDLADFLPRPGQAARRPR